MSSEFQVAHLEIESPYGNAGGVVKSVEDVELMAHTGVGWIEGGSYTLLSRVGNGPNGEVVYSHNPITGETGNALGMPNKGEDTIDNDGPVMVEIALRHGKPFVMNVAPVSEDIVEETQVLVAKAYNTGADLVLLNAGCPNVVTADGGRHEILSHNAEALELVLGGLEKIVLTHGRKIAIRTSPMENYDEATQIMSVIRNSGIVGAVFTPNTWGGYKPTDDSGNYILEVPGNAGGKSGPATADAALEQTVWAVNALQGSRIDVVSSGGIMTGRELHRRMLAGAVAGAGTTFFYESAEEGWSEATDKLLREYLQIVG